MNYEAARQSIKSGDLLAWSHRGWGSWYDFQVQMVRVFTRSEYCHVGIAWVIAGRVFVLESVQKGIRLFPLSRLLPFYWLPLPVLWTAEVEEFALSKLGAPYSKFQAVLAGVGELKAEDDNIWQCAEYAQAILRRLDCKLETQPTPSSLVQEAMRKGASITWVEES